MNIEKTWKDAKEYCNKVYNAPLNYNANEKQNNTTYQYNNFSVMC